MNWATIVTALGVAVAPVVVVAQSQSATGALKGRAITVRTCVERGTANGVRLTNLKDITGGENAAPVVKANRLLYWFHVPGDLKDRVGMLVEISASINEATEADMGFTAKDVVGEFDATMTDPVVNASNTPAAAPVGTTGGSEIPESLTLKLDITKVRNLPGKCG